jgi:hypothetical protein
MMPIANKVDLAHLSQLDWRQAKPLLPGLGHPQPAASGMLLKRVKGLIKIVTAPVTAPDLLDRYGLYPGRVAIIYGTGSFDLSQVQ